MKRLFLALLIGAAAFGLVIVLTSGQRQGTPQVEAAPAYAQRDSGQGGVEIEVIYVTPEYLRSGSGAQAQRHQPDRSAVFLVAMNTHSVDLLQYDMMKVSELKAAGKSYVALKWESTSDNNHHRSGVLIFPKVDPPLELVIKTIAGVPARTFRWTP